MISRYPYVTHKYRIIYDLVYYIIIYYYHIINRISYDLYDATGHSGLPTSLEAWTRCLAKKRLSAGLVRRARARSLWAHAGLSND